MKDSLPTWTPEPWEADFVDQGKGDPAYYEITATIPGLRQSGVIVDTCNCDSSLTIEEQGDNARRLVACVNACKGIPTVDLEAGIVGRLYSNAKTYLDIIMKGK